MVPTAPAPPVCTALSSPGQLCHCMCHLGKAWAPPCPHRCSQPALLILEAARCTLITRAHVGAGRDGARAARRLLSAGRWREEALFGVRALSKAFEVGGVGVRALFARQRRAGAGWAVVALCTGDRLSCCVIRAVEASGAESSTPGSELTIDIACRGAEEPR
eukprot:scaffold25556_cov70-Phaeocystis_antarctica.AAC.8